MASIPSTGSAPNPGDYGGFLRLLPPAAAALARQYFAAIRAKKYEEAAQILIKLKSALSKEGILVRFAGWIGTGPSFASQELAFVNVPFGSALPATTGSGPSRASAKALPNGKPPGGASGGADPFALPNAGGSRLPLPGSGKSRSPTLPNAQPKTPCFWPACRQFGKAAMG
jgi:hypothetical protein